MKRILCSALSLCLLFTVAISLCACSGETPQDTEGVMIATKDEAGNQIGYERRYHNDNGDITRLDVYDNDQVYDHFVLYEYDDSNRLTKETTYRADGIGEFYYTYEYYDGGQISKKGYYTATNGAEITLFDEKGNETERFIYDETDTLIKHEVYENGRWEESSEEATVSAE